MHFIPSGARQRNNFDLLRLCAAILVVFHHSFTVTASPEPLKSINSGDTFGNVGVLVFFAISGYLVTQSWSRTGRLLPFAIKRALRLLPALIVSTVLVGVVMGALVTTLPLGAYLRSHATHQYVIENSLLHTVYPLPGVFAHVPYPHVVNVSLWTIPLEVHAYLLVAVLGAIGLWRRAPVWLLLAAVLLMLNSAAISAHLPMSHPLLALVGGNRTDARYVATFCIGAVMYVERDRVALRWDLFAVGLAAYLLSLLATPTVHETVSIVTVPYLVLLLAHRSTSRARLPASVGDLSYGVYLYAFPIQQLLAQDVTHNPFVMFALAWPASTAVAFISWHAIETPALRLKPGAASPRRGWMSGLRSTDGVGAPRPLASQPLYADLPIGAQRTVPEAVPRAVPTATEVLPPLGR